MKRQKRELHLRGEKDERKNRKEEKKREEEKNRNLIGIGVPAAGPPCTNRVVTGHREFSKDMRNVRSREGSGGDEDGVGKEVMRME